MAAATNRSAVPRVQIAYESEGRQRRELPFVLGVLGDFMGNGGEPLPRLRERKFRAVDRATFDAAMEAMQPRLAFRVENKLQGDESTLGINLQFRALSDFQPEEVALQVPPLRQLIDLRSELSDLLREIHERRQTIR